MSPRSVLWSLLCCVPMVFASCHHPVPTTQAPSADPALASVDSLMWQQPDSALTRLIPWFDTEPATEYDRHYAHLLLAELLYKNDYEQTNRKELRLSVDYFDSLADGRDASATMVFLDARAHYMNGVGYYERDSVVEACGEYLKAMEIMENNFDEKELTGQKAKLTALAYSHLTQLFSDQYLHEQAIYFAQRSIPYYKKHNATYWHIAWVLTEIGAQYDMLEHLDSADYYYHQAMKTIPDTTGLTYRDIAAHQAYLRYKIEKQPDSVLIQLQYLLSKAESETERSARCLSIAELYYLERRYDSAKIYYSQVFNQTASVNAKILVAQRLMELCNTNNDSVSANLYSAFLSSYADAGDDRGKIHSQLTKLQQNYAQHKMENFYNRQEKRKHRIVNGVVWTLLSCIGLFVLLLLLSKRHVKEVETDKNEIEKQLVAEKHAHKIHQTVLSGRLKKSNELLRDVSQQLEKAKQNQQAILENPTTKNDFTAFKESPICQHILKTVDTYHFKAKMDHLLYKNRALKKTQKKLLSEMGNKYLGQFTVRMKSQYPSLTNEDLLYCYLYLLGLNEADISALMQRAYSTVCERNRKIKHIIGTIDDLSAILMGRL